MDNVKRALPRVSGSYFIDMWIDRLRLILRPGAAHRPCCILITEAAFGGGWVGGHFMGQVSQRVWWRGITH